MFWGIKVVPGEEHPLIPSDVLGTLHITQATLGTDPSKERSIVQCSVGDKEPIFLCSLSRGKVECCPLNLEFEGNESVAFSVIGPQSIYLSGYFRADSKDDDAEHYEIDSDGEDIAETDEDESSTYDTEDEYDDDFIDDSDFEMFPPSPVPNSGVVIEEIVEEEKLANGSNQSKRLKKPQLNESDENKDSQHQIVAKSGNGVQVLESEDEDGFPIAASHKSKSNDQNPASKAEEKTDKITTKEGKKKKAKDSGDHATGLKRKLNSVVQEDQPEREASQPFDSSKLSTEVVTENDVKRKKKKQQKERKANKAGIGDRSEVHMEDKTQSEEAETSNAHQVLPVANELDQKVNNEKSMDIVSDHDVDENHSEKKKKKKKKKSTGDVKKEQNITAVGDENGSIVEMEKKTEAKRSQVRTFGNGLVIEEVAMGKPDGKRASPGKKVSVHYIGKLKKNGKIFDSNVGRAPFKFRLGVGQVIKGWDVGVNGMRVGDKRRLTIPPSMGYGDQGAGKTIPPNSWLVFDVELVAVN